jgi:hypothetical protein
MFPSVPRRRRRVALAALALAAGIPAVATSAYATIAPGPFPGTLKGQVTLETISFGFTGTPGPISTASFTGAEAQFTWYRGAVGAHLTGTMHVDGGQNALFRVRVDRLTVNNDVIGDPVYDKANGTVIKKSSQDVTVDMAVPSAPNLGKLKIVLEEQGAGPNWRDRGEYYAQFVPRQDDVTILGKHIDVGGSQWDNGAPLDPAVVSWAVGADGALTATYRGYLHFNGFAGSGRVELRNVDPLTGLPGASADGDTHSSDGNGHDVSPQDTVSLTSSSSPTVEVVMQSWVPTPDGGYWSDLGSQTVSAGE